MGKRKHQSIDKEISCKKHKYESESSDDDDVDEHGNVKGLINYASSSDETEILSENEEENEEEELENVIFKILGQGNNAKKKFEDKINKSGFDTSMKTKLLLKLETPHLDTKQLEWMDNVLKIPFNKYSPPTIDISNKENVGKFFIELMNNMNKSVYGLHAVKEEIINYVAQTVTTKYPLPRILALQGVAGVGKTKIVREGISKALNRPMHSFALGGLRDSQHFVGHDYTYQHSKYGVIAQSLMEAKVMDPIFFFDELDKISNTAEGEDIENLLIHMTDPEQNHDFRDKYFSEISIDLSKVVIIFAFNKLENISPILRDRLHIINIPSPTAEEKLIIVKDYIIDELIKNIGLLRPDFIITEDAIKYIINKYSSSNEEYSCYDGRQSEENGGVRILKRCIETILLKINTIKLLGKNIKDIKLSFSNINYNLPIKVDKKDVDTFINSPKENNNSRDKYLFYTI